MARSWSQKATHYLTHQVERSKLLSGLSFMSQEGGKEWNVKG